MIAEDFDTCCSIATGLKKSGGGMERLPTVIDYIPSQRGKTSSMLLNKKMQNSLKLCDHINVTNIKSHNFKRKSFNLLL